MEDDGSPPIDLTSNTGKSDPNSIWGSGLLSTLTTLGTSGIQAYNTLNGKPTAPPQRGTAVAQPTAPAATPTWQKYLPWAIGGVVLLVVIGFVLKKR